MFMKKNISCFILLMMIIVNCIGCQNNSISKQAINNEIVAKSIKESGICNVSIDLKVELLGVVQYLADDPNILKEIKNNSGVEKYSEDISNYFFKYKDEPVVDFYKQMRELGYSYDRPPMTMMYVDDNLKLLNNVTLPDYIINSAGGKEQIVKLLDLLTDFRKKTKFDEFYMNHTDYYSSIVSKVKNRVDKIGCVEKLIKYYGYKENSYNIIIQPLSIGGYAGCVPTKDGISDVYDFMVVPEEDEEFSNLLIHEFGHSYINPLTEKNINEVYKYANLYLPIKESMSKQAYGNLSECVNEHIVRAVTYRILYDLYGSDVSRSYINLDESHSFIYIKSLSERLGEYENNRNTYSTINEFYPRILDELKELSDEEANKPK